MKGVAEVTVCQDVSLGHRPIIGMQLQYIGGHRACVGQFRFDKDLRKIRVEGAGSFTTDSPETMGGYQRAKTWWYAAEGLAVAHLTNGK